jgi:hypothetical protein
VISKVRDEALSILATRATLNAISNVYASIRSVNPTSGFLHPVGLVGPAELATLRYRLANNGFNSPQPGAFAVLLSGEGVPPKKYPGGWAPPINCPVEGYEGPMAMSKVEVKYGGKEANTANCPANYPAGAPRDSCGHISFVEMDGQVRQLRKIGPEYKNYGACPAQGSECVGQATAVSMQRTRGERLECTGSKEGARCWHAARSLH